MAEHMLILKLTSPEGETKYVDGRVPVGLRQDQPGDADPDPPGLEGRDDRRRHRLDEVRPGRAPVRDQSGGGLLRRRAGNEREDEPERDGDDPRVLDLHELRADRRRRHLVGGDDRGAARAPDRLARQRLDARRPTIRPRTRTRASRRLPRSVPRSRPSGRTPPACRSTRSCSAGAARPSCRSCARRSTGSTACSSGSIMSSETTAAAAGDVGKLRFDPFAMLPFCGYHMGDYFAPLARDRRSRAIRSKLPKLFNVNWFRKDADGQVPVARASARTAACWRGSSAAARATPRRSRRRRASCPRRGRDRHRGPRRERRGRWPSCCASTRTELAARAAARSTSTSPSSATGCRRSCASSSTELEKRLK